MLEQNLWDRNVLDVFEEKEGGSGQSQEKGEDEVEQLVRCQGKEHFVR